MRTIKRVPTIRLLTEYKNKIRNKIVPLKFVKLDGLKFYYTPGNMPQSPSPRVEGQEMHKRANGLFGSIAVDIGAHIGSYTLPLARTFKTVIAFEPNPYNRYILNLNVKLNKLSNVRVEPVALSNMTGVVPLYVQSDQGGTSSLNKKHYGIHYDKIVRVKVLRLDDFGFRNVGFVKIDVEGEELRVLKGASDTIERSKPVLGVEVHCPKVIRDSECHCDTCSFLRELGYVTRIVGEFVKTPVHWAWAEPKEWLSSREEAVTRSSMSAYR